MYTYIYLFVYPYKAYKIIFVVKMLQDSRLKEIILYLY